MLEISDLERRGILLCSENKGADQLRGYREADLRLCFRICNMLGSQDAAHFFTVHAVRQSCLNL